jgi:hypothetical protein
MYVVQEGAYVRGSALRVSLGASIDCSRRGLFRLATSTDSLQFIDFLKTKLVFLFIATHAAAVQSPVYADRQRHALRKDRQQRPDRPCSNDLTQLLNHDSTSDMPTSDVVQTRLRMAHCVMQDTDFT